MKKKIILSLIFIILILVILNINNVVKGFTFEVNNEFYDTQELGFNLLEYNIVFSDPYKLRLYTSNSPSIILDYGALSFTSLVYCYEYSSSSNSWRTYTYDNGVNFTGFKGWYNTSNINVYYLDYDILDSTGNIVIPSLNGFILELNIEPTETTTKLPVVISTQDLTENQALNYQLYCAEGEGEFKKCDVRSINYTNSDGDVSVKYQFYYNVYYNGDYHFKFINEETEEELTASVNVTNIVLTQDNIHNYINGIFKPTPFLGYEYVSDNEILITTQKFYIEELEKLECEYIKGLFDGNEDEVVWNKMSVRSFYDELARKETYQFYTSIVNDNLDADGIYTVRFYNKELNEYTYATLDLSFSNVIEYQSSLHEGNNLIQKYVSFFKERFGFLTYPFELFINVFEKIGNIKFETPRFHVPDIYEPTTGEKVISAIDFNFNDLLKNDTLKNIHDIYLIVVDVVIIFALVNLLKNKLMGVLGND